MARLTVTVITQDEEANLPRLLESVRGVADEVVVVDSGSKDRTVELARAAGARVFSNPWPGFREQKAFALAQASGDYVLNLDADEWLAPDLARALRAELDRPEGPRAGAFRIHFRHRFAGEPIRFGQMWRDRRVRLVRREGAAWTGSAVHPKLRVPGPVADLPGRCEHLGYRDRAEAERKLTRYAEQVARERFREGRRARPWDRLRWPLAFLRRYVLWLGFLDGAAGFTLARLYARYDADKARWLRRLEREVGGARGRGALASGVRELGRRAALGLASMLLPRSRRPLPPAPALRKLLVIRTDERVGNQLLTTPLLRALKEGLPQAELHLLAAARQAGVIESRHVDRLIPFEKRLAFRRPWRLLALLRALRRERYDLVVEAGHWSGFSLTASLLARVAAGSAPVVGHLRGESGRFLSHPVPHDPANENEVRAKLELLRPLGLLPRGLAPETELGREPELARALLAQAGVAGPFAVLNPGARMADRRWPPAAHAAVARGLAERGLAVLVVWGPGEEPIARAVAEGGGARLAPATGLRELAALLREARLCVSNNSGPMHLAVAVGTPAVVGVFLSGDARRWRHELPGFEAAEPRGEDDARAVLDACDLLLGAGGGRAPALRG
ncbi:glycosyltransferase family 9 protein [Anaeromyxobacter diazotrophicus]|nr:glycosyltransferase family 9 protein [Anaeromyxobacter diazotrophicus]